MWEESWRSDHEGNKDNSAWKVEPFEVWKYLFSEVAPILFVTLI